MILSLVKPAAMSLKVLTDTETKNWISFTALSNKYQHMEKWCTQYLKSVSFANLCYSKCNVSSTAGTVVENQ